MSKIDELPGNAVVKKHLLKLLEKTPHALLFEGPKGGQKGEFADAFARTLLKTEKKDPPDLRHLYPEGKAHHHPMDNIKQIIKEVALPPFEAKRKVFIIHDADRMLPSSANALLKTLEEPTGDAVIILVSSYPERLLPTVTSRCFRVPFSPFSQKEKEDLSEKMFHIGFRLLRGDLPTSRELPQIDHPEEALSYLFYFYRDLHLLRLGGDPSFLFYQDKKEVLSSIKGAIPPLEDIQKRIEECALASTLHIPFAHLLPILIGSSIFSAHTSP